MADLGAIGVSAADVRNMAGTSFWGTSYALGVCSQRPDVQVPEGRIIGTAKVAGIAAPYHAVMLIERSTRKLLRTTYANASGVFQFDGLNLATEDYMLVMMDEGDAGSYNSRTVDRVTAANPNA